MLISRCMKTYKNGTYTFVRSLQKGGQFGILDLVQDEKGKLFALKILDPNYLPPVESEEGEKEGEPLRVPEEEQLIGIDPYILREICLLKYIFKHAEDFEGVISPVDIFIINEESYTFGVVLPVFPEDLRTFIGNLH